MGNAIFYRNKQYPSAVSGGSGGGGSGYSEEQLYLATSTSFSNITVDWDWNDYDAYVFRAWDVITSNQSGDSTFLTKQQVLDTISNNAPQFFTNSYGYASYYISASMLTTVNHSNSMFLQELVGIKFGSGDGGSSEVNYSTEEQRIGTWIDGKPLYQKTFIVDGTYGGRQTVDVSASIPTNIDLRYAEGQCTYQYGGTWYYYSLGTYFSYPWENINTFKVDIGSATVPVKAYITIRYTKTTD